MPDGRWDDDVKLLRDPEGWPYIRLQLAGGHDLYDAEEELIRDAANAQGTVCALVYSAHRAAKRLTTDPGHAAEIGTLIERLTLDALRVVNFTEDLPALLHDLTADGVVIPLEQPPLP
jgi:hypothetical protein